MWRDDTNVHVGGRCAWWICERSDEVEGKDRVVDLFWKKKANEMKNKKIGLNPNTVVVREMTNAVSFGGGDTMVSIIAF